MNSCLRSRPRSGTRYGADVDGFEIGDGVTAVSGQMSGVHGTVVWFYAAGSPSPGIN
jgi:hypothetical protein